MDILCEPEIVQIYDIIEDTHWVLSYKKMLGLHYCWALVRQLSILTTKLDILDKPNYYVHILFIYQRHFLLSWPQLINPWPHNATFWRIKDI